MQQTICEQVKLCQHKIPTKFGYKIKDGQAYWISDGCEHFVGNIISVLYDVDHGGLILKHGSPMTVDGVLEKYRSTPLFTNIRVASFDVNKNGVEWLNDSLACTGSFSRFAAMQVFIDEYTLYDYYKASLGEGRLAEKFVKSPSAMLIRLVDFITKSNEEKDAD